MEINFMSLHSMSSKFPNWNEQILKVWTLGVTQLYRSTLIFRILEPLQVMFLVLSTFCFEVLTRNSQQTHKTNCSMLKCSSLDYKMSIIQILRQVYLL